MAHDLLNDGHRERRVEALVAVRQVESVANHHLSFDKTKSRRRYNEILSGLRELRDVSRCLSALSIQCNAMGARSRDRDLFNPMGRTL